MIEAKVEDCPRAALVRDSGLVLPGAIVGWKACAWHVAAIDFFRANHESGSPLQHR